MGLEFIDCKKITDTLMYLDNYIRLTLTVNLVNKDKNKNERFFESEYMYPQEYRGIQKYSINRNFLVYFNISDVRDYKNSIMIKISDLMMLRLALKNIAYRWFVGRDRIYSIQDGQLVISGKYTELEFPTNDYNVLKIVPIICIYPDGKRCEGVRVFVNSQSIFADMAIDKFWEFFYYLTEMDPYSIACSMINYAKTKPYSINPMDNGRSEYYSDSPDRNGGDSKGNFFGNL